MLLMIWKDVKNILSDKKILTVILLMPFILMTILGLSLKSAFSSEGSGITHMDIVVVKEYDHEADLTMYQDILEQMNLGDIGEVADPEEIFFQDFLSDDQVKKMLSYKLVSRAEADRLLAEDRIPAAIILPEKFIFNTLMNLTVSRNVVTIELLKNSNSPNSSSIVEQLLRQFTNTLNRMIVRRMTLQPYLMDEEQREGLPLEDLLLPQEEIEVSLTVKEVSGKEVWDSFQYYAVAMMAMFTLYAAGFGGRALIDEKKNYTLHRLKVSGRKLQLSVVSNFIRVILIVIIQSILMIVFSSLLLGVEYGNLLYMLLPVLLNAISIGSLGMLVSVITLVSGSYAFANAFEYGIVNLMALVGGSFIPVQILPKAVQNLRFFSTSGNALDLFLNTISGDPVSEVMSNIMSLLLMNLLFIVTSCIILRLRMKTELL